jgi:autotransporter-associated beta strand protein
MGTGLTVINSGSITGGLSGDGVTQANAITFTGGSNVLELQSGSVISGHVVGTGSDTLRLGGSTSSSFDVSGIGALAQYQGFASFVKTGSSTWTLTGATTTTTPWIISQGTVNVSADAALGASNGALTLGGGTLQWGASFASARAITLSGGGGTFDTQANQATLSGGISGSGDLTKTGSGTLTLSGVNAYTGATLVNGGVLNVAGTITGTSAVTVNAGGVLMGAGTIDPLVVTIASGGTLAPGNGTPGTSTSIVGNLAFQSGATYLVQVNPSTASFASVTGSATLGGATVNAVFAAGSYISKTYTILTAAGGVTGTFASNVVNTNLPANFHTALSYDAGDAYLNLALNFSIPGGLDGNQRAVGNALGNFFTSTGGIPLVYGALTTSGLTQAAGELGTSSQQTTFQAMTQFMGILADPFMQRSGGDGSASSAPLAYAAGGRSDALAMFTKAAPRTFEPRWSVWGAGYGGSQSTDGNAATGSSTTTSSIYGSAVGADYLVSPNTLAGFALAGGGTNFSVNGLGSGRSDLFQAGAYVRHFNGPAYVSAALAYGWQDITTDRIVTVSGADHLRAQFNANAWSGRLEGGYRVLMPWAGGVGLTPYAAAQFTTFDLPAYAEQAVSGAATFALAYAGKTVTDTRTELGLRTDKSFAVEQGMFTLRGRLAWAHDFEPGRGIAATFQALPGASFVVNGAAQARDSALTTAAAEMTWRNGWSATAAFEGEFSKVTASYAGRGIVRYRW